MVQASLSYGPSIHLTHHSSSYSQSYISWTISQACLHLYTSIERTHHQSKICVESITQAFTWFVRLFLTQFIGMSCYWFMARIHCFNLQLEVLGVGYMLQLEVLGVGYMLVESKICAMCWVYAVLISNNWSVTVFHVLQLDWLVISFMA